MNNKIYVKSREWYREKSECLLHAKFTSSNRVHPETFRTERAVVNKIAADVGMLLSGSDTKETMICIDNKYGFIELTNFYQITQNFSYLFTKMSHVTRSILNCTGELLYTLTRDAVSSFYLRIWNNLTENSCKLTYKCFRYIIKELLNWYW